MKKTLSAILIMLMVLIFSAVPAFANAPAPDPSSVTLTITHPELLRAVRMVLYDENGNDLHEEKDYLGNTFEKAERDILKEIADEGPGEKIAFYFLNGDLRDFAFEFTLTDGTVITTDPIAPDSELYHKYVFNAKTHEFKKGSSSSDGVFLSNCFNVLSFGLVFLIPCAFTILIEWLISLAFRLKPGRVVVLTNLCTNLGMNIIISLICGLIPVNYYIIVLIAEILVMGIEFLIYSKKYRSHPKWKILIYTVVANVASWGLYALTLALFT